MINALAGLLNAQEAAAENHARAVELRDMGHEDAAYWQESAGWWHESAREWRALMDDDDFEPFFVTTEVSE